MPTVNVAAQTLCQNDLGGELGDAAAPFRQVPPGAGGEPVFRPGITSARSPDLGAGGESGARPVLTLPRIPLLAVELVLRLTATRS